MRHSNLLDGGIVDSIPVILILNNVDEHYFKRRAVLCTVYPCTPSFFLGSGEGSLPFICLQRNNFGRTFAGLVIIQSPRKRPLLGLGTRLILALEVPDSLRFCGG